MGSLELQPNCGPGCQFTENRTRAHLLRHIRAGIPTKVTYKQLVAEDLAPRRCDFINKTIATAVRDQFRVGGSMIFMPNSVYETNTYSGHTATYTPYIFGVLPCGTKAAVILEGVELYVDILIPPNTSTVGFTTIISERMKDECVQYKRMSNHTKYKLYGFQTKPSEFLRVHFHNIQNRRKMIDKICKDYITASDDISGYFNKVARDMRFATADWNRIEKYRLDPEATTCGITMRVNVKDYRQFNPNKPHDIPPQLTADLDKDATMVCMWDIETYRTVQNGVPPEAMDTDYTIFNICSVFMPHWTAVPVYRACVIIGETALHDGIDLIIECADERELLQGHIAVLAGMSPDIMGAFNGGNFDWPLVREKMKRCGLLPDLKRALSAIKLAKRDDNDNIYRWSFRTERIKIDAENEHTLQCVAEFPGLLDTDVQPVFRRKYPKAEVGMMGSLNFYLAKNQLPAKEDMPYKRMFHIYERSMQLAAAPRECHCVVGSVRQQLNRGAPDCPACKSHIPDIDANRPAGCCWCSARTQNLHDMADVGYYCVVDCIRPQQLYVKQLVVADRRELSTMSYVTLRDSFYRADGMKVRNLIGAYCNKRGVAFSNLRKEKSPHSKDHYPGAWVFPPVRGLNNKRPIAGMDFASLYPSIMMTYNLSPDMIVYTREDAEALAAEGYELYHIEPFSFERGLKKDNPANQRLTAEGWTVRHCGVHHPDGNRTIAGYDRTTTYKFGAETIVAADGSAEFIAAEVRRAQGEKCTRSARYTPQPGRDALPGEKMGVFPFILKKLFDRRVPIKAEFERLKGIIEQMGKTSTKTYLLDGVVRTLEDIMFIRDRVEAKQKAIKVLSNTFYGESGNYTSPAYELLVAAGVTCAGRANIKKVNAYTTGLGFVTNYGDTDSLYLECPAAAFADLDAAAAAGQPKLEYWTAMVRRTMEVMSELRVDISEFLMRDNGTLFLNMSYEEVGFPSVMCGKKKYFMTEHLKDVNFYPREIFIRGIDIIKQGRAKVLKMLGEEFMREALSPENDRELIDIAQDKIAKFYTTAKDPALFSLSARYRPHKKNIPVLRFAARMTEIAARYTAAGDHAMAALYAPPEPGDKFEYVVVKKPQRYTMQGLMIKIGNGDKMEYVHVYVESQRPGSMIAPMDIDIRYYMKGSITGLFSRFIAYHPQFQPKHIGDMTDKKQYKLMDKECVVAANKYIEALCNSITGFNKKDAATIGRVYQKIYKGVDRALRVDMYAKYGLGSSLLFTDETPERLLEKLQNDAAAVTDKRPADGFVANCVAAGVSVHELRHIYNRIGGGVITDRMRLCAESKKKTMARLRELLPCTGKITARYMRGVGALIESLRKGGELTQEQIDAANALGEDERANIAAVYDLYLDLCAVQSICQTMGLIGAALV